MPNVNSALDSLMNLFTPTPGGKFFLGRGDNPAIVVPRDTIDGTMAKLYRDRRMVYIHNESGATGFAKLNPGIGIDYQDYSFGAARLPVMTEIKDGVRYISEIAPEGLVMLGGRTLTERTTQTLYAHGIEQLTLLRGAPTNPPSLSVRVDGTWIYRDPYTNGRGAFQTDTIDLAADIDALTANQHQLAVICFDAVNHALVRVLNTASTKPAGKTLPCPEEFSVYDVIAVDTGEYVPVVAVYLYDAQTEITENSFYRVYPMRPIFNGDTRLLMLPAASSAGISDNEIYANRMFHTLYAESGASDDLDTIYPIEDRQMIFLQAGGGQTINVRHNQGNIFFNGGSGFELTDEKTLMLVHDGTNWSDIASNTVGTGGPGSTPESYVLLRDEKTQNTDGGTFTSGSWQVRDINTEVSDTDGICSIGSNQITLVAGTYRVNLSCPAYAVGAHQCRLYNATDASVIAYGTSEYARQVGGNGDATTRSHLSYKFTLSGTKTLEIQHQCQTTKATNGLGTLCNFATEVYTVAEFWKEN